MRMFGIGVDLMAVMITFVISTGVILGKKNNLNKYFLLMLLLNALTLLADIGTLTFMGDAAALTLLQVSLILQLSFTFLGVAMFNLYIDVVLSEKKGARPMYRIVPFVIVFILMIVCVTSIETGVLFQIDANANVKYDNYFWIVELLGSFIVIFDVARVIKSQLMKEIPVPMAVDIYIFVAIPMIMLVVQELLGGSLSLLYAATTVAFLTYYMSMNMHQNYIMMNESIGAVKAQTELVLSQIQPHFVFNTLATIKYLCSSNPHLAIEAVTRFAKYLRRNLDTISNENLVRFKDELEHTKNYLWLEQLRFGKNLKVEYSIDCDNFDVPPLSLQPIVENAVKHGITKKTGGGLITISVRELDECYRITVSDDGVGFDKQERSKEHHIGIADVRMRMSQLNGSTLHVQSAIGVGTSVVYEIMKDE